MAQENQLRAAISSKEARTDALTGLGNRRALIDDLAVELSRPDDGRDLAVALCDLNGFKQLTTPSGTRPAIPARPARRTSTAVAESGTAYRIAGDEFCVLARIQLDGGDSLVRLAADPLTEAGEGFQIECSYGLALLPAQASSSEGALQVVACLGLLALAAGALAASPLPQRAKAYATNGNHHGVSVTLVTSASNPKRLEPGEAATASQFALSGGDVQCKKAKKGPGFHEVSFAVFGFPGATLKLWQVRLLEDDEGAEHVRTRRHRNPLQPEGEDRRHGRQPVLDQGNREGDRGAVHDEEAGRVHCQAGPEDPSGTRSVAELRCAPGTCCPHGPGRTVSRHRNLQAACSVALAPAPSPPRSRESSVTTSSNAAAPSFATSRSLGISATRSRLSGPSCGST